MKLTAASVERTLTQLDAQAVPDNHPVAEQLRNVFGNHTYFLDGNGLSIVEPAERNDAGETVCAVLNIADWADESQRTLMPHEPELTSTVVVLGADAETEN
ncbi:MAG TPA: hypothetical protein VNR11_13510 [Xanthobacteraceae bacterium]|nr:hypothetical protein [Xanthobacteraceae bacterium]